MQKIPSKPTLIFFAGFIIFLFAGLYSYKASAKENWSSDQYWYVDVKVGYWTDANYGGEEPDGKVPIVFSFGRKYEDAWGIEHFDIFFEAKHRSNLDLGWPFGPAGEDEYSRNGGFAGATYKFKELFGN